MGAFKPQENIMRDRAIWNDGRLIRRNNIIDNSFSKPISQSLGDQRIHHHIAKTNRPKLGQPLGLYHF